MDFEIERATYTIERNMPRTHYHKHYEVLYIYNNTRTLVVGDREYLLDKNTVAIIPPFIPHLTLSGGVLPQERLAINFYESYIHDIRIALGDDILNCAGTPCSVIDTSSFAEKFSSIITELQNSDSETERKLILCTLLHLLSKNSPARTKNEDAGEIIKFVEANFGERITLDLLSEKFHLSKFTVSRYFSRYTGMSLPKYLNSIRVINAKKYLRDGQKVTDVAFRCGFESVSNFDRVFTNQVGISPMKFKKA
ncbi:MAG: helix-turn-helix domain-containing protein [Ruminococcaceae bacterium]|nr:helix-turn-helix domain-containing protein [Oscillospiraceae bacterium]